MVVKKKGKALGKVILAALGMGSRGRLPHVNRPRLLMQAAAQHVAAGVAEDQADQGGGG